MSILTKYILKKYLINFLIVLISLELFFVGIDFLQNYKSIPNSANLQILYILYNGFFTLTLTLPLSIVFGWIVTLVIFIKNNELVAFNSLGATRKKIYSPVVKISLLLIVFLISLQATPLAYSYEQKRKILQNEYFINTKEDIFLKYNNYYVYFQKLFPLEKRAENIHIFKIDDKDIVQSITAQKAYFQKDKWFVIDAKILNKPKELNLSNSKIEIKNEKFLITLEGFRPKILDNFYENRSNVSIIDAFSALFLLNQQDINTDKIRAVLYNQIIIPFFVIPILLLVFANASLNSRFFNISRFTSFSIFGTLMVWGLFFALFKFTNGGIISPELSIVLPMIIWTFGSLYFYKKQINS